MLGPDPRNKDTGGGQSVIASSFAMTIPSFFLLEFSYPKPLKLFESSRTRAGVEHVGDGDVVLGAVHAQLVVRLQGAVDQDLQDEPRFYRMRYSNVQAVSVPSQLQYSASFTTNSCVTSILKQIHDVQYSLPIYMSAHVDNNSFTPRLITPKEKKGREDKARVR
ncbi:hypothetical protein EJB05_02699, partial [Eragrostis curvula]